MNKLRVTRLLLVGSIFFAIQIVMAIYFALERTVFIDIAYHIFFFFLNENFAIQNYRFGAFFTQLLPLIGVKLGLSLHFIAILYSISFVVMYCLCFLILLLFFKNRKLAMAYLLFTSILTTHTFFWIQSELPQGMVFLFLTFASIEKQNEKKSYSWQSILIIIALLFMVCFTHPLLIIPFLVYVLFNTKIVVAQKLFSFFYSIIFICFYILKSIFFSNAYDAEAIDKLNNFKGLFPNYFTIQANKNFAYYVSQHYQLLVIVLGITVVYLFKEKLFKKINLLLTCFICILLLVNVSYHGGAQQFYLENQYLLLAFVVAFIFSNEIAMQSISFKWAKYMVPISCILCIGRIIMVSKEYTNRIVWQKNLLQTTAQLPNKKLVLKANDAPQELLKLTWGASYEFWLLSTIQNGQARSIIIEEHENEFEKSMQQKNMFITKWATFDYKSLPKQYFQFKDTGTYVYYE